MENKKIVIDTHNYLYDFINTDNFIGSFYQMVSHLKQNNITPFFVYDGKPPPEKRETIQYRSEQKNKNQQKYEELLEKLPPSPETTALLQTYKAGFTRLTHMHLHDSKQLLNLLQVAYHESEGESDPICVAMVNTGQVWACMSQDMDMFLYGCKRVVRKYEGAYYLYDFDQIMKELHMDTRSFRQLFVLLGTDYGKRRYVNIDRLYHLYSEFYQEQNRDFLQWLCANYPHYLTKTEHQDAERICSIFAELPNVNIICRIMPQVRPPVTGPSVM